MSYSRACSSPPSKVESFTNHLLRSRNWRHLKCGCLLDSRHLHHRDNLAHFQSLIIG